MPQGSHGWRTGIWYALLFVISSSSTACQRSWLSADDPVSAPAPPALPAAPASAVESRPGAAAPASAVTTTPARVDSQIIRTAQTAPPPAAAPAATPLLDSLEHRNEVITRASLESINIPDLEQKPDPKPLTPPRRAATAAKEPSAGEKDAAQELLLPSSSRGGASSISAAIDPERASAPRKPEEQWREALDLLRTLAREHTGAGDKDAGDWPLKSRLLDWIAGPETETDPPALWRTVLTALATANTPTPVDEAKRATAIRAAIEALEEQASPEITALVLCRKVNGFGSFEPIDSTSCKANRPVIVYCELAGVRYEPSGDTFRSRLAAQVEILSARDEKPISTHALGTAEDVCPRKRRDYYVNYRITLPKSLGPGSYILRLTQKDLNSDRTATHSVTFSIKP